MDVPVLNIKLKTFAMFFVMALVTVLINNMVPAIRKRVRAGVGSGNGENGEG